MLLAVRSQQVERLRRELAVLDGGVSSTRDDELPFGLSAIDGRLAGGGLRRNALHEAAPARAALCDDAAATLFVAGASARLAAGKGTVVWALTRPDLYAPGLEQAGLPAANVLHAEARDDPTVLALMEDALRHGGLAAVVGEVRRADMTATRRLQLAAAEAGVPAFLLRRWRKQDACPLSEPSAAATRWSITSVSSAPLTHPGVGRGRWEVACVRQRGGEPFTIIVEACDAQGRLALSSAAPDRAAAMDRAVVRAA